MIVLLQGIDDTFHLRTDDNENGLTYEVSFVSPGWYRLSVRPMGQGMFAYHLVSADDLESLMRRYRHDLRTWYRVPVLDKLPG